jgi:hypothetical protein
MTDRIYGIHQSQPHDVYAYTVANAAKAGLDAKPYMLSSYPGTFEPGTTQVVFEDKPGFYDEKLLDGRTRRYSVVTMYVVSVAPRSFVGVTDIVEQSLSKLGYSDLRSMSTYATPAALASALAVPEEEVGSMSGGARIDMIAGTPRYFGDDENPEDVPQDGSQYARTNTGWSPIDLSQYETIQGTNDKIDAALGSTFNSRNVLLTSSTALFADGEPATVDPVSGPGWYYKNTAGNKINWYFYSGGSDSETLGQLQAAEGGFYMLLQTRNATSWPYVTFYTQREGLTGNAGSFYRSRINYGPGGDYSNKLSLGAHILHTPNLAQSIKDELAVKYPSATFTQLEIDPISSTGPQLSTEQLSLATVSTSSGAPAEQEAFLLEETAMFFDSKARSWQFVAIPAQQPEYTNYYKGAYAQEADYPESGTLGQWIIDSTDETMLVWDVEGGDWKATGSTAEVPASGVQDYPFQYVYSSFDGSGYGFTDATPASAWQNTPDGKIQSNSFSGSILGRRVKFATLKNPGDEVTVQVSDNTGAYNRYTFIGLTPGTDAESLSWKVAGQPSSGTSWMFTDAADRDAVEMYSAYIEPYFGGTSYGYNMVGRSNSNGLSGLSGNQGEKQVTFRVGDDYRIEMYIDGNYFVKTSNVPTSGVDLYYTMYGNTGRILEQPTGNGQNFIGGTAPNATGARYFMSTASTPGTATELASGNGFFLYSDLQPGDASDVELDDQEANAARFCRVFQDYTGLTLQERAELTLPIVSQDEKGLSQVEYLARGYFHSLDLELTEIQAKMALYAPALAAATAGSVEACLAQLQMLTLPVAAGGEAIDIDPFYSGYSTGGNSDTRWTIPTSSQTRADYGMTSMRFWGQGTSVGQMEFYFDSYNQPNAALDWASQDRTITFNVPGSDPAFEGTYTLTPAEVVYQSGSQVTYTNPDTWNHINVESLAQWATSNGLASGLATVTLEAPAPTSPALALGEGAVVSELIALLQLHLQKFPR